MNTFSIGISSTNNSQNFFDFSSEGNTEIKDYVDSSKSGHFSSVSLDIDASSSFGTKVTTSKQSSSIKNNFVTQDYVVNFDSKQSSLVFVDFDFDSNSQIDVNTSASSSVHINPDSSPEFSFDDFDFDFDELLPSEINYLISKHHSHGENSEHGEVQLHLKKADFNGDGIINGSDLADFAFTYDVKKGNNLPKRHSTKKRNKRHRRPRSNFDFDVIIDGYDISLST